VECERGRPDKNRDGLFQEVPVEDGVLLQVQFVAGEVESVALHPTVLRLGWGLCVLVPLLL
jgi:hypothetical protein